MEKKLFTYVILGVLVWAILGTTVAAYYLVQYDTYQSEYNNLVNELATYNSLVNDLANQLGAYNNLVDGLANQLTEYNDIMDQLDASMGNISEMLEGISLKVNILLSYDNGTKAWYNDTVLPLGATAFTAVLSIADEINYTDYGGELGILITSINGVVNNSTSMQGWFYWYWDFRSSKWTLPSYSCAKHILHKGDTIAFTYVSYTEWPPPTPT